MIHVIATVFFCIAVAAAVIATLGGSFILLALAVNKFLN